MKRKFLIMSAFVSLIGAPLARGQSIWPSILNATGGSTYIGTKEFEWSVGEMALVNTFTTSSIVVTQGLLQTRLSTDINEVPGITNLGDYLQIYPNPTTGAINIQYNANKEGVITLKLMDMAGRLITDLKSEVKPGANNQKLDISALAAATYMLEVYMQPTNGKMEATAYKIQKLQ